MEIQLKLNGSSKLFTPLGQKLQAAVVTGSAINLTGHIGKNLSFE